MNSDLRRAAARHRKAVLQADRAALTELIELYKPAHVATRAGAAAMAARIAEATKAGEELSPSWLFRQERYQAMQAQIEREMASFAPKGAAVVERAQRDSIVRAAEHADEKIRAASHVELGVRSAFDRANLGAARSMVGFGSDGSPLRELFRKIGPVVGDEVRASLVRGVSLGRHPSRTAREIVKASGMGLTRASTIARTETLRAYREATRLAYEDSGVVTGWVWLSTADGDTCPACWAMHGETFDTGDYQEAHPNCRCSMVPQTGDVEVQTGEEVFDGLDEGTQDRYLGTARAEGLREGRFSFKDMQTRKRSRRWGATRQVTPLRDLL